MESTDIEQGIGGVYAIRHKSTGKMYIGSSCNIRTRLTTHIRELNCGTSPHPKLQSAWNDYGGADAFEIVVLKKIQRAPRIPGAGFLEWFYADCRVSVTRYTEEQRIWKRFRKRASFNAVKAGRWI